jgi:preprotein translocase subunit SecA
MIDRVLGLFGRGQQTIPSPPGEMTATDADVQRLILWSAMLTDAELQAWIQTQSPVSVRQIDPETLSRLIAVAAEAGHRVLSCLPTLAQVNAAAAMYRGQSVRLPVAEDAGIISLFAGVVAVALGEHVHILVADDASVDSLVRAFRPICAWLAIPLVERQSAFVEERAAITVLTPQEVLDHLSGSWWEPGPGWAAPPERALALLPFGEMLASASAGTRLTASRDDATAQDIVERADLMARRLKEGREFRVDRRLNVATLTELGVEAVARRINLDKPADDRFAQYVYQLGQSMLAHARYQRDRDYVVLDGDIVPLDSTNGSLRFGRLFSGGLHEALQVKEGLAVRSPESFGASLTISGLLEQYPRSGVACIDPVVSNLLHHSFSRIPVPQQPPWIAEGRELPSWSHTGDEGMYLSMSVEIEAAARERRPVLGVFASMAAAQHVSALLHEREVPHELIGDDVRDAGDLATRALRSEAAPVLWVYPVAGCRLSRSAGTPRPALEESADSLIVVAEHIASFDLEHDVVSLLAAPFGRSASFRLHVVAPSPPRQGKRRASSGERDYRQDHAMAVVQSQYLRQCNQLRYRVAAKSDRLTTLVALTRPEVARLVRLLLPPGGTERWDRTTFLRVLQQYVPNCALPDHRELRKLTPDDQVEIVLEQMRIYWSATLDGPDAEDRLNRASDLARTLVDIMSRRYHGELQALARGIGARDLRWMSAFECYKAEAAELFQIAEEQIGQELLLGITQIIDTMQPVPVEHNTVRRDHPKVGRNDPCFCGSGKKYKRCCGMNS